MFSYFYVYWALLFCPLSILLILIGYHLDNIKNKDKYYRVVYCNNGKIQYSIPMVEEVAKDYLEIFDDAIMIEEVRNDNRNAKM